MASPSTIFDRAELMTIIESKCLTGPCDSAVVIGAHKVGKTYLLDYIYQREAGGRENSLFCRMDLNMLRAFSEDETLSDTVFLRFFLFELLAQINDWVENQGSQKDSWLAIIEQTERELTREMTERGVVSEPDDPRRRAVDALKQKLRELGTLIEVAGKIQMLVNQSEPLKFIQVMNILNDLRRIRKRVILIIDDFNELIKEEGLSNKLFTFLRGANGERKIITLVSSIVHPMDASLYQTADISDRKSLVNHYHVQFLNTFDNQEVDQFLNWLGSPVPPLTQDEKSYIQGLGGGSPFFIQTALELFLQHNRPASAAARKEFEKNQLMPALLGPFSQIWSRCSVDDRTTLQQIAAGDTPEAAACCNLEKEGYLLRSEEKLKIFSTLFTDFISQERAKSSQSKASTVAPEQLSSRELSRTGANLPGAHFFVNPKVLSTILPTSLYVAAMEYADLVSFEITNNTKETYTLYISCQIEDFSQETTRTIQVPPGTHKETLPVTFHPEKVSFIKDPLGTQVKYRAELILGTQNQLLATKTEPVRLLPLNNFIFARYEASEKRLVDYTWLITAWVRARGKRLQEILRQARAIQSLVGHPVPKGVKGKEQIRSVVAALYQAVQQQQLDYHNQVLVFHQADEDYIQRVQFPEETLENKAANCLDGSVLFASLLSMCDLAPAILFLPKHAMVGWKNMNSPDAEWEFLDFTVITNGTFEEASRIGQHKYLKVKSKCSKKIDSSFVLNPEDFAILVDIGETFKRLRTLPLLSDVT